MDAHAVLHSHCHIRIGLKRSGCCRRLTKLKLSIYGTGVRHFWQRSSWYNVLSFLPQTHRYGFVGGGKRFCSLILDFIFGLDILVNDLDVVYIPIYVTKLIFKKYSLHLIFQYSNPLSYFDAATASLIQIQCSLPRPITPR